MIIKDNDNFIVEETGEIIEPKYQDWTYEEYKKANIKWIEPMTAKEEEREEKLEEMFNSKDYYAELKLDGTRATVHFNKDCTRVFSRRVSKKTNWFCENTDSLPQLQEVIPELIGTVIDGELMIPNRPFKDIASVMNCKWDKAIERQIELGFAVFNAFDVIYYKGVYVARMPLWRRKELLNKLLYKVNNYFEDVHYFDEVIVFNTSDHAQKEFNKKEYYEYVVKNGEEGIMLKHKEGKYYHKRGREYTKVKKFLTKDVVILGFTDPTPEYEGKFPTPEKWNYWIDCNFNDKKYNTSDPHQLAEVKKIKTCKPISKYYYEDWVGNIRFGVIITKKEKEELLKSKKAKEFKFVQVYGEEFLEVGECSGFDEEMRKHLSDNKEDYIGTTIEILANEMFLDTGKLRHPRFSRIREDKAPEKCTWEDHINP